MLIHIKNLRLRTVIGIFEWEREQEQDIIVNCWVEFDGLRAAESDSIDDTVDYKTLKQKMIAEVHDNAYYLIEKLAARLVAIALEDDKVSSATVEIDKPNALHFCDSVSVRHSDAR